MEFVKSVVLQMDLQEELVYTKAVGMEFILEINTKVSPCATSHSVGLNLCGTSLLFFLASAELFCSRYSHQLHLLLF